MTRSDFLAAGFTYQPPTGDPLRWRMADVRVYCHAQPSTTGQALYALWAVGADSYVLSTSADPNDEQAVLERLPMGNAELLQKAVEAFLGIRIHP